MKNNKNIIWTGVLTAIGSSLCCITPLLALISGATGMAASFTWIEPLRPYLMVVTFLVLGFAWYQKLKPKKEMACVCDAEKPSFFQSKSYLVMMTLFALVMLGFPYWSQAFYSEPTKQIIVVDKANMKQVDFTVEGMTCAACESHITHAVNELEGVLNIQTSFETGNTTVEFDDSKTSEKEIEDAIRSTGYVVRK